MRLRSFIGVAASGLLGVGVLGCSGSSDPVAASSGPYTVAPEATQGPEAAAKAELEAAKKQAEADKKAGRH